MVISGYFYGMTWISRNETCIYNVLMGNRVLTAAHSVSFVHVPVRLYVRGWPVFIHRRIRNIKAWYCISISVVMTYVNILCYSWMGVENSTSVLWLKQLPSVWSQETTWAAAGQVGDKTVPRRLLMQTYTHAVTCSRCTVLMTNYFIPELCRLINKYFHFVDLEDTSMFTHCVNSNEIISDNVGNKE